MPLYIDIIRKPRIEAVELTVDDGLTVTTIRLPDYIEALRLDALLRRLLTGKRTRAFAETPEVSRKLKRRAEADAKKRRDANWNHSRTAPLKEVA